ncbi:hypothetical protein EIN_485580 [Entamoeba invadens IP1]|uniref:Uncharacterized protein n=1 Tax=Entamoeba invadens IP1 TaxID=370355 RepID=A0A0A1U4I7_ENTIV|nr:hypothetical protein EIN_485580 [Entamoeba invadens IP1]ELP89166.1 hypothetical protein EIN_485580 [Entamoeba invadens IP1]|eukprot:XP_004255937.1 hypothetical protein EIN_485580 [Entamoeba invadens IP1]
MATNLFDKVFDRLGALTSRVVKLTEIVQNLQRVVGELKSQSQTSPDQRAQRLLTASSEQCKKIQKYLTTTQDDMTQFTNALATQYNEKIMNDVEDTSSVLIMTKRDFSTTKTKTDVLFETSKRIQEMLRMNDLALVSSKGSVPKRMNVTTAIYEDKIYQLSTVWFATISSNSISGRKCVSLYTGDKSVAVHVYYAEERFFYCFFQGNEYKYDIKEDAISKLNVELHLEWKRLACEVVNIPTGSFFSKTRNGKSAVFYVRESMIVVRLDSGDVIVLDSESSAIYINTKRLILYHHFHQNH